MILLVVLVLCLPVDSRGEVIRSCLGIYDNRALTPPEAFATAASGGKTYIVDVTSTTVLEPAALNLGDGWWQRMQDYVYEVDGDVLPGRTVGGTRFDAVISAKRLKRGEESSACGTGGASWTLPIKK